MRRRPNVATPLLRPVVMPWRKLLAIGLVVVVALPASNCDYVPQMERLSGLQVGAPQS